MGDEYEDVLADGVWQTRFKVKPAVFTREEKRAWLNQLTDVTLGSDAFFPFSDNIERAHKSGVKYIAQPGGSSAMMRSSNAVISMTWRWYLPESDCSITKLHKTAHRLG